MGLDAQMLAAGHPVETMGTRLAFMHYGDRDPDGLTLLVQIGVVAQEDQALALRRLLHFNALTPAAVCGYYALVPGTDDVVFCWRFDIANTANAAPHIVSVVSGMCRSAVDVRKTLDELLQKETPR